MTNERVEVITSVERRRRWSVAEKRQLVAATQRIVMRADKTDQSFASMIHLVAAVINSR